MNNNKKKKEPQYITTFPRNVNDNGNKPSFAKYLGSRVIIPIILSFVLFMFKGGIVYIILMWSVVIITAVVNYEEMYPASRPSTKQEIKAYRLYQLEEAQKAKRCYEHTLAESDEYGYVRRNGERYSDRAKWGMKRLSFDEDNVPDWFMSEDKRKHKAFLDEYRSKFAEYEDEYGPNWYEILKKEIEEDGV